MSSEGHFSQVELTDVAMQIILHAGDARSAVRRCYEALAAGEAATAADRLQNAREEIRLAHQAQTDIVQAEARGARIDLTVLFAHAQDTLMTVNSEVTTATNVMLALEGTATRLTALEQRLSRLEEAG